MSPPLYTLAQYRAEAWNGGENLDDCLDGMVLPYRVWNCLSFMMFEGGRYGKVTLDWLARNVDTWVVETPNMGKVSVGQLKNELRRVHGIEL